MKDMHAWMHASTKKSLCGTEAKKMKIFENKRCSLYNQKISVWYTDSTTTTMYCIWFGIYQIKIWSRWMDIIYIIYKYIRHELADLWEKPRAATLFYLCSNVSYASRRYPFLFSYCVSVQEDHIDNNDHHNNIHIMVTFKISMKIWNTVMSDECNKKILYNLTCLYTC